MNVRFSSLECFYGLDIAKGRALGPSKQAKASPPVTPSSQPPITRTTSSPPSKNSKASRDNVLPVGDR